MAKEKTVYVCSNCGQDSPKWVGKCPSCGEWNTYVEEIVRKEPTNRRPVSGIETQKPKPLALSDIEADESLFSDYRLYTDYFHRKYRIVSRKYSASQRVFGVYSSFCERNAYACIADRTY